MNKFIPILFAVVLVFSIAAVSLAAGTEDNTTQRAYFKIKNDNGKALVKGITKYEFPNNTFVIETTKKNIEKLKKMGDVEFVDYDHIYYLAASTEQSFMARRVPTCQASLADDYSGGGGCGGGGGFYRVCYPTASRKIDWGTKIMYEDATILNTSGGRNVKVAVLDTGANKTHPDIASRIKYCRDFTTNSSDPANVYSCEDNYTLSSGGHGTPVASIIAANGGPDKNGMWGMAPESDLYIIKVCRDTCIESDIIAGIYDAVINKSVNIISMSFAGATLYPETKNALDYAADHNVLMVAAAGNKPDLTSIGYPAAYVKVMSVGATYNYPPYGKCWLNTAPGNNVNDFIRSEGEIEFGAPGAAVYGASKDGCGYVSYTGTSFSAPYIAGLAAKIWDGNAVSTRTKLQNSAHYVSGHDIPPTGEDSCTGFGLPTVKMP